MGRVLSRSAPWEGGFCGGWALEETFNCFKHFAGRSRRVNSSAKFAAVTDAMTKPASELLHFSHSIRQIRCSYFPVVARK
jgi:hypothetical protein